MITNQEIVDTYLAYKHRVRTKGERVDNTLPLMPFFIMDACYQIYCKDIKNLPCKHLLKKHKKRWADSYHMFTADFFRAFNQEQTEYIVDMMDEFNDYIHNTIVMLKSAVVNYIPNDVPFEEKKLIGSLLACSILAQAAQHMYGEMFRKGTVLYNMNALHSVLTIMPKEKDPHIEAVKRAVHDFANCFSSAQTVITVSENVMSVIDSLCVHIVKFLKQKENETQDNKANAS
jgi:hypothetical protein